MKISIQGNIELQQNDTLEFSYPTLSMEEKPGGFGYTGACTISVKDGERRRKIVVSATTIKHELLPETNIKHEFVEYIRQLLENAAQANWKE